MASPNPGIIITLLVKRRPDLTFNTTYLRETHIPLVAKHWGPHGFMGGTPTRVMDDNSEYAYMITMKFASEEGWLNAVKDEEGMKIILDDVKPVTNGEPVLVVGKVLA